ncbi:KH domain-containing protein At1g09660/At1g09670-like isoform X2 [Phoenix dactylifera]|uniref:KH domain-containing protein At1g09660/At1g09670-like isoform X2 n=1 Tax=Phoenix dactylifera TaxID=42345 RepID=A0A8B7BVT6_PHODC|nr:KH domain-containing protein At1g09660/At1g09670-like isoform X2 [Phoenix dactylifera]
MDDRIPPSNTYFHYFPSGIPPNSSPHHHPIRPPPPPTPLDRERYLAELMAERQKLVPFMRVLPFCSRILNQEIFRASVLAPNQNFVTERMEHGSPLRIAGHTTKGGSMDLDGWSAMQVEENGWNGAFHASAVGWNGAPGVATSPVVKKVVRLDVPVNKFPNYNFVGRLLGPRGNSLKRVEATTQCRVYIRGQGSVKDTLKEEKLRDTPGYDHLSEPLHVLVEAEFPADVVDARLSQAVGILEDLLKPVDESKDYYKKQQLRELALLNGTLREESPQMSPSVSPFNSTGMKRAKTRQ